MSEKKPKLNNVFCPLNHGNVCKGRLCIFWENPNFNEMKDVAKMCLVRQALINFSVGESNR